MIIGKIENGIVIDHIKAGKGMELYRMLGLDSLDCQVALIKNAESGKLGRKDIIKVDRMIDVNLDIIGYIDPEITVNIIKDGKREKVEHLELPEEIVDIIKCKNPRCITTTEQELPHVFRLTDKENRIYRCLYCESKAK
ncbi:MAG: aspartate carbamoyltransferase regulatory subunit [Anaerovoracaceae bacterium]|nr:aspartate carbamoyltransferase regulatory subunit [Anaerovoracaceae bacterium]